MYPHPVVQATVLGLGGTGYVGRGYRGRSPGELRFEWPDGDSNLAVTATIITITAIVHSAIGIIMAGLAAHRARRAVF